MNTPENAEVSVLLCTDLFIQKLNHEYRSLDKPTDVLAFALQLDATMPSGVSTAPQSGLPCILGDIIISVDTAARQAKSNGIALVAETTMLLAHGLLHLLGYDHAEPDEAKTMFSKQAELIHIATAKQ